MNLNKLEKAAKILAQIQTLDKEILEIDQFAIKVANRDCDCNIKIDLTELKKEVNKEDVFDEHGFIQNKYLGKEDKKEASIYYAMSSLRSLSFLYDRGSCTTPMPDKILSHKLSDKETLQILGIFLSNKHESRNLLLAALKKLGYEI